MPHAHASHAAMAEYFVGVTSCFCIRDYDHLFHSHVPQKNNKFGYCDMALNKETKEVEQGSGQTMITRNIEVKEEELAMTTV